MKNPEDRLLGIVCDDRPDVRRSVAGLLALCGFEVAAEADSFLPLRSLITELQPAVVVMALPVVGMLGISSLPTLRQAAPASAIVLLSSFEGLEHPALDAGAAALVAEDDPHALQAVLLAAAATARSRRSSPTGVLDIGVDPA